MAIAPSVSWPESLQTRNWEKWHEEHPYIRHPRQKGESAEHYDTRMKTEFSQYLKEHAAVSLAEKGVSAHHSDSFEKGGLASHESTSKALKAGLDSGSLKENATLHESIAKTQTELLPSMKGAEHERMQASIAGHLGAAEGIHGAIAQHEDAHKLVAPTVSAPKVSEPKSETTGIQGFDPAIHEKVKAKDLKPGDMVSGYQDRKLYPAGARPPEGFKPTSRTEKGYVAEHNEATYGGKPTFQRVTGVTIERTGHSIQLAGGDHPALGGGNATVYARLKTAEAPPAPKPTVSKPEPKVTEVTGNHPGFKELTTAQYSEKAAKVGGVTGSDPHTAIYNEAGKSAYAEAVASSMNGAALRRASSNKGYSKAKVAHAKGDHAEQARLLGVAHAYAQASNERKLQEKGVTPPKPSEPKVPNEPKPPTPHEPKPPAAPPEPKPVPPSVSKPPSTQPETKYLPGSPKYKAFMAGHKVGLSGAQRDNYSAEMARRQADNHEAEAKKMPAGVNRASSEGLAAGLRQHAATVDASPASKEIHPKSGYEVGSPEHSAWQQGHTAAQMDARSDHTMTPEKARKQALDTLRATATTEGPTKANLEGRAAGLEELASSIERHTPSSSPATPNGPLAPGNPHPASTAAHTRFNSGYARADRVVVGSGPNGMKPVQAAALRNMESEKMAQANDPLVKAEHAGAVARYGEIAGESGDPQTPQQIADQQYTDSMASEKTAGELAAEAARAGLAAQEARRTFGYSNPETEKQQAIQRGLLRASDHKAFTEARANFTIHGTPKLAPRSGWKKLTQAQAHQVITDSMVLKNVNPGFARQEADRLSATHETHLMSDGSMVHFNKTTKVIPAKQKIVLDTVASLRGKNTNRPPVEVFVGSARVPVGSRPGRRPGRFGSGTLGYALLGSPQIWVAPATFKPEQDAQFAANVRSGHFMPVGSTTNPISYVLAHEYGHTIDKHTSDATHPVHEHISPQSNTRFNQDLSRYGRTKRVESYAEAHAEWFLSGGKTTNPTVRAIAAAAGWSA